MVRPADVTWSRPAVVALAVLTTLVSLLGGVGVLPAGPASAGSGAVSASLASQTVLPDGRRGPRTVQATAPALPDDSGRGTRVVFSIGEQRVWLVEAGERGDVVRRTHLASGSVYDNLQPGTFEVYSRSRHATGIGDSGTMEYFVRFTRGANAAIGFHSIPVSDGEPVQTRGQLGTPLSHGCIRQWRPDARALWDFAPVGRTVVVTA
ncbi:L,D-transpeptidase [Nocardioides aurantiacus]|uniref:Lipoprotein-anchoring transpeptidase ErfK/SrfK n=1 Tax=Nocardioides aurantiacus TaxID=86796 RepID=A0A3N2CY41_9ACTN|nr:L,D-transpeptidase [Nocardioides aurantiacus]ROR92396.1 lipoprotein-anchoring transpeptidase ErfK/SrfK [Nocardioides aurantiacus]